MIRFAFITLGLAVGMATTFAGEDPLALQVLESEFEEQVATEQAELAARYREAVVTLAKEFKESGNLDGVLAIETELAASDRAAEEAAANVPTPIFTLSSGAASAVGTVRKAAKHRLLVSWKPGGAARWNIAELPPGSYSVTLLHYAGPFSGGTLELRAGASSKSLKITAGDNWKRLEALPIGNLEIHNDAAQLELSVIESRALGVFELSAVELVATD